MLKDPRIDKVEYLLLPQILTKDSVTISVDGVVYFRVSDPISSVANVANADFSTRLLAQTTLRNVLGTKNLAEVLSDRESIAQSMQVQIQNQRYQSMNFSCIAFFLYFTNLNHCVLHLNVWHLNIYEFMYFQAILSAVVSVQA